jgi:phosphate transport system substrate-binding protein
VLRAGRKRVLLSMEIEQMTKIDVAQALLPARRRRRQVDATFHTEGLRRFAPRADRSVCATQGTSSRTIAAFSAFLAFLFAPLALAGTLRVNGSTTVNAVATEAAELLRAEKMMTITVDTQGGSSGGISGIGDRSIDIGMSSKPLSDEDRKKYPGVNFVSTIVGQDAVALVVSKDVWDGGVKALTRAQTKDIYEGRITNWNQVGGPDRRIVFFNKEPGRGTWEVFAHWLYGNPKNAPAVSHREVGGNEEARTKVATTKGAITQLSYAWAEGDARIHVLGAKLDDGRVVVPSARSVADHSFPMSRSLLLITDGPPKGEARVFIDFVLSSRGRELVRKHGFLPPESAAAGAN